MKVHPNKDNKVNESKVQINNFFNLLLQSSDTGDALRKCYINTFFQNASKITDIFLFLFVYFCKRLYNLFAMRLESGEMCCF